MMTEYLMRFTNLQYRCRVLAQAKKVKGLQEKFGQAKGPEEKRLELILEAERSSLSNIFTSQRTVFANYDDAANRAMLVLEKQADIRLRQKQVEMIRTLIELKPGTQKHKDLIAQLVMGGGKSKVILPILAQTYADGEHVAMVVAPAALKEVVASDLHKEARRAFGKRVRTLEFSRGAEAFDVAEVLELLNEAVKERQVIVTTAHALHCIRLGFLETLSQKEPDLEKVGDYLKIFRCLEEKGIAVIDEIDSVLNGRVEAHFTFGEAREIVGTQVELTCELYRTLIGQIKRLDQIISPEEHEKLKPQLIDEALNLKVLKLSDREKQEVRAFIEGKQDFPASIEGQLVKKNLVALLKEQITNLLPTTLNKPADVRFGRSSKPLRRPYAIPYKANNVPNELADFANEFETLNYTMQLYLKKGITTAYAKLVMEGWIERASEEAISEDKKLDETTVGKHFKTLFGKSLYVVDSESAEDQAYIQEMHLKHPELIFEFVNTYVLPAIKQFPELLSSYAPDLVDLFLTVQGLTGTPWNRDAMPERIETQLDPGTEGQIIDKMLSDKRPVTIVKQGNAREMLTQLQKKNPDGFE